MRVFNKILRIVAAAHAPDLPLPLHSLYTVISTPLTEPSELPAVLDALGIHDCGEGELVEAEADHQLGPDVEGVAEHEEDQSGGEELLELVSD